MPVLSIGFEPTPREGPVSQTGAAACYATIAKIGDPTGNRTPVQRLKASCPTSRR